MTQRTPEQTALDREFLLAAGQLHAARMRDFLARGADPNTRQSWNDEPILSHVAMYGSVEEMLILIEHGADVSAVDATGRNALDCALEQGELGNARLLIAHGASINQQASPGQTMPPWATAIMYDQRFPSTLRTAFILEHAPDFSLRFEYGTKPGQTLWDMLSAYDDRWHGLQIREMVTEWVQERKRERLEAEQQARRQSSLQKHHKRDKGKFKL